MADLLEAEGHALRRNVVRLQHSFALTIIATVLALSGFGLTLWALYQAMVAALGPSLGAFFTGLLGLLGAGLVSWIAHLISR